MSDRLVDVNSIFRQALELASRDERAAFIDKACTGNSELVARVNALLKARDETGTFVDVSDGHPVVTASHDDSASVYIAIGSSIGAYKLLEKIGEGGFGSIYVAQQQEPVRRRVALKIIKLGMDTKQVIARFEAERQALAMMDHPNIAKVFDAGSTESGRPYFVMELVQGIPVTEYCDSHKLDTRQRIGLFVTICHAIQHAHDRGVVHRDIKPSNVLVATGDDLPLPKVIDFGIAKATQQPLTERTIYTAANQVLGTPRYMSPEQAGKVGASIDARSDVYSLGVLLYELLTGTTPLTSELQGRMPSDELYRMIREHEPTKPSTNISTLGQAVKTVAQSRATDPVSLRKLLRGDLDWIILRCLEKDPQRRYKRVSELADDLKRHLASEPVLASPPSRVYRLRKLLQRRRGFFIAATFVFLAIAAGSIASVTFLVSSRRLARETQLVADGKRLGDLIDDLPGLPGIEYSTRRLAMDQWIESVESVVLRLKDPTVPIGPTMEQQYERAQQLIRSRVEGPEGVLELAKGWAARTPANQQFDAQWGECSASVASEWDGLVLKPMEGLYPLGQDTRSSFWQFVDLRTGLAPQRDRDGNFVVDEKMGIVFVLLPGGQYLKGSPDNEEDRKDDEFNCQVSLNPFMISQYEVTQAQWERIMGRNPSGFDGANRPVDTLSWNNCQEYCLKTRMHLPSEAQWEYACRAHQPGPFSGSGLIDEMGWYGENSGEQTHPVGEKKPNQFGLYDMHGNVLEWCQDVYAKDFFRQPQATQLDPVNEEVSDTDAPVRVLKGGSCIGPSKHCRSADRYKEDPDYRYKLFGMRPIVPIDPRRKL